MTRHTLSVLVENKPGVLVRIAGLFARRGFNIDSLAVGPTEHEEISRITIVVNCDEHPLEQGQVRQRRELGFVAPARTGGAASGACGERHRNLLFMAVCDHSECM